MYRLEFLSANTKYEIKKFLGKWMELENIILSKVTQTQRNTQGMHSLISRYKLKTSI